MTPLDLRSRRSLVLGVLATLPVLLAVPARAATVRVPADQPTIQAGVDAAAAGDTVLVAPGVYTGPGNRNISPGGKDVVILAEGCPDGTVIDCQNAGQGFLYSNGETASSVLEGFTITHGVVNGVGGGMDISGASPTITNCVFSSNHASTAGAVWIDGGSPTVTGCVFAGNVATGGGGAVDHQGGGTSHFVDCTFCGNSADRGGAIDTWWGGTTVRLDQCSLWGNISSAGNAAGIQARGGAHIDIQGAIIAGGVGGAGVTCDALGSTISLACGDVWGNAGGDFVDCLAGLDGVGGNFSADPLFTNPTACDLTLQSGSPCLPGHHPDGVPCGGLGAVLDPCLGSPTATQPTTWGSIRARFGG